MSTPAAEAPAGRPAWTGAITFGLVAVPVKLYPATVSHAGPVTHWYHRPDAARVRNKKFCEVENREVPYEEIAKGSDVGAKTVVLTDEDLETLPLPSKHVVDVVAFVPEEQINPLTWDSPYYVGLGDKAPAKPYKLLAQALRDSGQVAVTKIAFRERESMAILRERDGVMILQTVRWPDEVRSPAGIKHPDAEEPVDKREIKMALQYAAARSEGYDLEAERDAYVVALEELLEAKAGGGEAKPGAEPVEAATPVLDLMAALKASIAETQAQREPPRAKKATTTKKTPAKRAPRKAG